MLSKMPTVKSRPNFGKKIALIIGPELSGSSSQNGQTIKLLALKGLLKNIYEEVHVFSTGGIKSKPWKLLALLPAVRSADDVWLVLSRNGTKLLLPFLVSTKKRIFYANVGIGNLLMESDCDKNDAFEIVNYLSDPSRWKYHEGILSRSFQKCCSVIVESPIMKNNFETVFGCKNVVVLPNFRSKPINEFTDSGRKNNSFVFLSRFTPVKGLESLVKVSERLSKLGFDFTIDLFGPISIKDKKWSEAFIPSLPSNIRYRGSVSQSQIEVIAKYDALVFPTESSEGMPGVIVEALIGSTPVISSNFTYAKDIIEDGVNGFIFEFCNLDSFEEAMIKFMSLSNEKKKNMRLEAKKSSEKLSEDYALEIVKNIVN